MNKGIVPIIVIIIAVIILGGSIGGYVYFKNKSSKVIEEVKNCENIEDQNEKDYCYSDLAVAEQDVSICDKMQNSILKNYCYGEIYNEIAITKKDVSICEKIQDVQDLGLKDECYRGVAWAKNDPSICDKLEETNPIEMYSRVPTRKERCYSSIMHNWDLASNELDLSICDKIQDQGYKDYCYSLVAVNKQGCDKILTQNTKDICYLDLASSEQDLSICDNIQNQEIKDSCCILSPFVECPIVTSISTSTSTMDISDWKTYKNEKYGFTIRYPSFMQINESESGVSVDNGAIYINDFLKTEEECIFISKETSDKQDLTLRKANQKINGILFNYYVNYPENIGSYCGMSAGCWYHDIYRTFHKGLCYEISYIRADRIEDLSSTSTSESSLGGYKYLSNEELKVPESFKQILSTFRFLP